MSERHDPHGRRLPVKLDATTNGEFAPVPLALVGCLVAAVVAGESGVILRVAVGLAGNAVALCLGDAILRLAQTFPELVLGLLRIASRSALYTGRLTGDHNAVVRVAAFFLSVSGRLRAQGQSGCEMYWTA